MAQAPQQGTQRQMLKGSALVAATAAAVAFFTGQPAAAAFFITFATSYTLGQVSARMAAKGWSQEVVDRRDMIRSAVAPRRVVYGNVLVSGSLVYAQVTGSEKEYLHLVVAVAEGEVHSLGELWLNDQRLDDPDGSGNITTGPYANSVRVKKYVGTTTQTADADLVSESGGKWTTNHRLQGIAYFYLRLRWNQDVFANGIPNVRILVRGPRVFDPRDAGSRVTANPALLRRHYYLASYGLGCDSTEVDDTTIATAANWCDQWVALDASVSLSVTCDPAKDILTTSTNESRVSTGDRCTLNAAVAPTGLPGGTYYVIRLDATTLRLASSYVNALEGVHVTFSTAGTTVTLNSFSQRRYAAHGTFTLDQTPAEIDDGLQAAMAGSAVYSEGKWRIYAGVYTAPSITLTADDLRGPYVVEPRKARKELINEIRGTYTDPSKGWISTDFAPVRDATYVSQDGGDVSTRSIDLAWVTNPFNAQRLAKIFLRRSRAAQIVMPCKLTAFQAAAAETISVSLPQVGYSSRVHRVLGWKLNGEDGAIGVDIVAEEDAADIYDWSAAEGIPPLQWSTVDRVEPLTIGPPTGLVMTSTDADAILGTDGTRISRINVSWSAAAEPNKIGYEVQWRKASASGFSESMQVPANITQVYIGSVQDSVVYDVRVKTIRANGQASVWLNGSHTVSPKTGSVTAPTSLTVTPAPGGYDLVWSASSDNDYRDSTVLEATSNNRAAAVELVTVAGTRFSRTGLSGSESRWYWVRHNDRTGNESTYFPVSATGGRTGVTLALGGGGVRTVANASTITAAPGSNPPGGDDYWAVYSEHDRAMWRWQPAGGAYSKTTDGGDIAAGTIAADRIAVANLAAISANLGSITAGSIDIGGGKFAVDTSGNATIRSGTTGQRLEITNNVIRVYDASGVLRVKIGDLS
jgi:hypothetical protein